jgi:choline dehydrogenase
LDPVVTQSGPDYYTGKGKRLLRIQNECHVSRVLFDGVKAKGVEFVYANGKKTGKAYGKKIILSAGAINSPAILQRSGIGDPAVLEPLGIKVLVNNPNVGANLQNQYGTFIYTSTPSGAILGEAFLNCSSQGYPADSTRRVQLSVLPISGTLTQVAVFVLNPTSRGFINIVSKDPLIQPFINLNMYSDGPVTQLGTDANLVAAGIRIIGNALGTLIQPPQADVGNPTALYAYMTSLDGLVPEDHIVSTTQMGTSIENGVVDGNLHVFGVKNLMVADIGVLPYSIDGNLCMGAYMVGLRAATICGVSAVPAL